MRLLLALALLLPSVIATAQPKKVVFVTGDEEYRSEESMPMLARILKRDYGMDVSVAYAVNDRGIIDPNRNDNIAGLKALEDADLMVIFTRWRALPDSQLKYITDYVESGRPVVGFRTSTHTFKYDNDPAKAYLNDRWPEQVFGQRWIVHHGHFDDGANPLTQVDLVPWKQQHPILRGVEPFQAYSWLYHVDGTGPDDQLQGDARPLVTGTSLKSSHQIEGRLAQYPLTQPVAWTKSYTGASGKAARVFFTTLGHPYDFRHASMRKLALNGILWSLGMETQIPEGGARAEVVGTYEPNNSGFGDKYKHGMRPADL